MTSAISGQSGFTPVDPVVRVKMQRAAMERVAGNPEFAKAAELAVAQLVGVRLEQGGADSVALQTFSSRPQLSKPSDMRGAASLTLLMAEMQEMMSQSTNSGLETKLQLFLSQQESLKGSILEEAQKAADAAAQAEQAQKAMGCIGKIIGAILTVVAVLAAIPSGGASLALAAVGVALFVAEEVVKAATGVSIMGEMLSPLMDNVIKPMAQLFAKVVSDTLKSMGVDEKTADMVGSVVGAVLAAVAVVAALFLLKKVPTQAITKALGKVAAKVVPDFMKKIGTNMSRNLGAKTSQLQSMVGGAEKAQGYAKNMERASLAVRVGHTGLQAGGDVFVGVKTKEVRDAEANLLEALATHKALEKMVEEAMDVFSRQIQMLSQSMRRAFEAADQSLTTGKNIQALQRNARV